MKIGFDISQTGQHKAGCGFYTENLINMLTWIDTDNKYSLYENFGDNIWNNADTQLFTTTHPHFQAFTLNHSTHHEAKTFWRQNSTHLEKTLGKMDIIHSNNFFCPPKMNHTKIIYTLYDLSFLEYPECTTEQNRIACFDGIFKASLHADFIIAISEFSRNHFLKIFPHYPKERICVIYPASRFKNSSAYPGTLLKLSPGKFWLNVGTIEPRKNIKRMLFSYAKFKARSKKNYPLVFAGKLGWLSDDIHSLIHTLNLQNDVHLLGYVNNDQLHWLYKNCFCLLYPSLFEGFGLPILEALTFGKPVISSNVSSIPEIVGDAGILINPLLEDELLNAMHRMSTDIDYRKYLKKTAEIQSKKFSWEKSAKALLEIYTTVVVSL